jgi:hypothetical protein
MASGVGTESDGSGDLFGSPGANLSWLGKVYLQYLWYRRAGLFSICHTLVVLPQDTACSPRAVEDYHHIPSSLAWFRALVFTATGSITAAVPGSQTGFANRLQDPWMCCQFQSLLSQKCDLSQSACGEVCLPCSNYPCSPCTVPLA